MLILSSTSSALSRWGLALGILLVGGAVWRVAVHVGLGRLKKWAATTETPLDDLVLALAEKTLTPLALYGLGWAAMRALSVHPGVEKVFHTAGVILLTVVAIRLILGGLRFFVLGQWGPAQRDETLQRQMKGLMPFLSVLVWGLGSIFLLDNLGFKVSTMVAGLGIGGVAVALASQAILGDLFSYFSILFDRPFELGDTIEVGDVVGTVENIGVKTTRLRSISGEQIIFSNSALTGSRIRNFKRMQKRRVVFRLGVAYQTPVEVLEKLPRAIAEVIDSVPTARLDRAHLAAFGAFSLDFEVAYFVLSSDYTVYMDTQQTIQLNILRDFHGRGVSFAYPTQMIYHQAAGAPP